MEKEYIDKEKNNENNLIKIFIILFLICIIMFLVFRRFGFIEHKYQTSNNYIDIFNITFGNECNPDNQNPSTSDKDPDEDDPNDKGVQVFDDDKKYEYETNVNIFRQETEHVVSGKVAPASQGSYEFIVRNNNDFGIIYDIDFKEINKYDINMKYRLKLNGDYIIGGDHKWVTVDKLDLNDYLLSGKLQDKYVLEWKWEEDSNDTKIGMNFKANYNLSLKISATI